MDKKDNLPEEEIIESTGENIAQEENKTEDKTKELEEKLIRSLAENENTRKRYEKMLDEAKDYSVAKFAKDMLTVMDNLTLALAHKDEASVVGGVELTKKELKSLFNKYHIEEISPKIGEKFDYNLHDAISEIENKEFEAGSILNVMQTGYKLKDRLLRPAFVSVSKK